MSQIGTQTGTSILAPRPPAPTDKFQLAGDPRRARLMVDRMTFGFTRAELALYNQLGFEGYLAYHLHPSAIDDSAVDAYLAINAPTLIMTPLQLSQLSQQSDATNQLIRARLYRAIFSKRQLFERAVECFTDHFNIWIRDEPSTYLKVADDRDVVRANALGTFPAMLRASAHSASMLSYLNNDTNTAAAPNENYARELMELHTLSVSGGYSQSDVHEVARCLTGWTYYTGTPANAYTFRYNSAVHDVGQKIVLGNIIPARPAASGQQDGDDVLNILANHPSTRQFVARKIIRHFHMYDPAPQALVDSVAATYLATGGDIAAMISTVLRYAYNSPTVTPKFKRPSHLLASTLRGLNAIVTATNNLQTPLTEAGHVPFDWQSPDGFPDALTSWTGLLLARWNFGARLMNNSNSNNGDWWSTSTSAGVRVDHTTVVGTSTTAATIVNAINLNLFNGQLPKPEQTLLLNYLLPTPTTTTIREALGLAVSLPTFQWY